MLKEKALPAEILSQTFCTQLNRHRDTLPSLQSLLITCTYKPEKNWLWEVIPSLRIRINPHKSLVNGQTIKHLFLSPGSKGFKQSTCLARSAHFSDVFPVGPSVRNGAHRKSRNAHWKHAWYMFGPCQHHASIWSHILNSLGSSLLSHPIAEDSAQLGFGNSRARHRKKLELFEKPP